MPAAVGRIYIQYPVDAVLVGGQFHHGVVVAQFDQSFLSNRSRVCLLRPLRAPPVPTGPGVRPAPPVPIPGPVPPVAPPPRSPVSSLLLSPGGGGGGLVSPLGGLSGWGAGSPGPGPESPGAGGAGEVVEGVAELGQAFAGARDQLAGAPSDTGACLLQSLPDALERSAATAQSPHDRRPGQGHRSVTGRRRSWRPASEAAQFVDGCRR